jgi:cell division protein FtsN
MVSLSSTASTSGDPGEAPEAEATPTATDSLRTTFSFYEHLTAAPKKADQTKREAPTEETSDEKPRASDTAEEPPSEEDEAPAPETEESDPAPAESDAAEKPAEPPKAAAKEDTDDAAGEDSGGVLDRLTRALGDDDSETDGAEAAEKSRPALPARYTLQVSSHPDRDSAEREMDRLREVGVEPHVVVVEVPGKGKLWRIRVGKFHEMDEARAFQRSLKSKRGVPGFVTPL